MNPKSTLRIAAIHSQPDVAAGPARSWTAFWFSPSDPIGLHIVRILAGLLFLGWLLPFAGQVEAFFSLHGWFDQQAFTQLRQVFTQLGDRPGVLEQFTGWSILYLLDDNPVVLQLVYWLSIMVLILFTLGIATRLTALLSFIIVASFTAPPPLVYDGDALLVMLAFYLALGYVFLGQRTEGLSPAARLLGSWNTFILARRFGHLPGRREPSLAANIALRLLQVHMVVVILASALHKLQFAEWWTGAALWYALSPPFETTAETVRKLAPYLDVLGIAAYVILAWQLGFPLFAWRVRWRPVLLGGALLGWFGSAFIYKLPLFGPAIFIGCLAFVTPEEWNGLLGWLSRIRGVSREVDEPNAKRDRSSSPVASRRS